MPDIMQYPDRAVLAEDLVEIGDEQLNDAVAMNGKASRAVPGGTTPGAFLKALSVQNVDWPNVSVMLTDERFVDENSPRSNTRLLRETLLQGKAAMATLVVMVKAGEQTGPGRAAAGRVVHLRESKTVLRQIIQAGGIDFTAIAAEIGVAEIVGEDEEDVETGWFFRLRFRRGGEGSAEGEGEDGDVKRANHLSETFGVRWLDTALLVIGLTMTLY